MAAQTAGHPCAHHADGLDLLDHPSPRPAAAAHRRSGTKRRLRRRVAADLAVARYRVRARGPCNATGDSSPVLDSRLRLCVLHCLRPGHASQRGPVFGSTIARVRDVGGDMLQQLPVYGLAAVCIAATAMPFHKDETWWVRATDFPRTQIAVLIIVTLAAMAALLEFTWFDWALAFVLLVCLGAQLAVILPYTRLWPVQVRAADGASAARALSLLVVNVLMDNRAVDRLATLIGSKDPDVVLAVETDEWWSKRLQDVLPNHSFKIAHPLSNTYGMILLSRLELVDPQVRFLLKPDIPSILTGVRLRSGEVLTLYGLHPEPPAPGEADTSLPRDAELVLAAREIGEGGDATIVAGDFNDVAWSHTSRLFRRISRLLDPRVGRGMYNTFHAGYPVLRWPLDHVFVSDAFLLRRMERLPAFGSDHFPIYIALAHAPAASAVQEAPEPDADDRAEARDKVDRAGDERS